MTPEPTTPTTVGGFRTLEFDLPTALLEQIVSMFADLDAAALIPNNTGSVPNAQGVYQLFLRGRLVYIGKTDAQAGLKQRLSRHAWNIKSRHNLDVKEITFKAIQVLVFSAMDLETALISFYREADGPPVWNGSGFGNNDPGRRRDTTALKPEGFDALYPINIDLDVEAAWETAASALGALSTLSAAVPYTIRHEKTADALVELKNAKPQPPQGPTSVRRAVSEICSSLPSGWQATRLSGRVIIYREAKDDYPGGEIIARS